MFSSRGEPFLVTETDAQSIGGPSTNYPAYPGQWRQAAWALVARGARMVEYWHWHTLHYGTETYWGGVLPHSGLPGSGLSGDRAASVRSSRAPAARSPTRHPTPTSRSCRRPSRGSRSPASRRCSSTTARGTANSYPRIVARSTAARSMPGSRCECSARATSSTRRRRRPPAPTRSSSRRATTRPLTRPGLAPAGTPKPAGTSSSARGRATRTMRPARAPRPSPRAVRAGRRLVRRVLQPRRAGPGARVRRAPARRGRGGHGLGRVPRRRRRRRPCHLRPPAPGSLGGDHHRGRTVPVG